MAVYVGQKDGDFKRVLVPVLYINHPLFGQLLREAEEEYGHDHAGGITIPCRFSDFENVKTRIAAEREPEVIQAERNQHSHILEEAGRRISGKMGTTHFANARALKPIIH
ncbi:auxin-responsive protein SAUR36-like protein [Tanacetum coccineum]